MKAPRVVLHRVGDLKPYARNARTHSAEQVEQIARSISEFGWTSPILLDGKRGVIAGHGRLLAAQKLGLAQVPCIELAHLSKEQRRALVIADNQLALNAGWDPGVLKLEIGALKADGFDVALLGFSLDAIGGLMAGKGQELTDEPATKPSVSRKGDVWLLGTHRLVVGDSGSDADVAVLAWQAFSGEAATLRGGRATFEDIASERGVKRRGRKAAA